MALTWHQRRGVAFGVPTGAVLYFALVPHADAEETGQPRVKAAFWLMAVAACVLGAVVGRPGGDAAGAAMGAIQVPLAFFTYPQGDGDGLWILVLPMLALLSLLFYALAGLGSKLRDGPPDPHGCDPGAE